MKNRPGMAHILRIADVPSVKPPIPKKVSLTLLYPSLVLNDADRCPVKWPKCRNTS